MQIHALADELGVNATLVKNFLRDRDLTGGSTLVGARQSLSREQVRAVRAAHARGELRHDAGVKHDVLPPRSVSGPEIGSHDIACLPDAVAGKSRTGPSRPGGYALYVHEDVLYWLDDGNTPVEQRAVMTRRMQELMAHGRATRVKGVKGSNAGWLRTPLGGNGGNQFYLWYLDHGAPVRGQKEASAALFAEHRERSLFLRAVRHHDATEDVLDVGRARDYTSMPAAGVVLGDRDGLACPLVDQQREVTRDTARVRVIVGKPGARKTTALQSVASTLTGRVLYVTWSGRLAERARQFLDTFAPGEVDVRVWTFRELLGHVDRSRPLPPELLFEEAMARLRAVVGPSLNGGPWRRHGKLLAEQLFAEMHAHAYGAALPVAFDGRRAASEPWLADDDYRSLRAESMSERALDEVLRARSLLDAQQARAIFGGPVAAFERALALQRGELVLDAEFSFDWVLVDEVQDLTLSEQWLLVDVAARCGRARGVKIGIVIAGDESQTVRPTAFEFGRLSKMLDLRLGAGQKLRSHGLSENLRSPAAIARLLERAASALYGRLPRRERPRGTGGASPADVTVGRVLQVDVSTPEDLRHVLRAFEGLSGDAALVHPSSTVPEPLRGVARELGVTVWTTETIKGLEFRTVGVLDFPATVRNIESLASSEGGMDLRSIEWARTSIDRLMVALSRASETLVLIGSDWRDGCETLAEIVGRRGIEGDLGELEGHLGFVSVGALENLLGVDAADAVERIEVLLESSACLLDQRLWEDALRATDNAHGLLGDEGRPGSASPELRRRVRRARARCRMALALARDDAGMLGTACRAWHTASREDHACRAVALARTLEHRRGEPIAAESLEEVAKAFDEFAREEPLLAELTSAAVLRRMQVVTERDLPRAPRERERLVAALASLASTAPVDRTAMRAEHRRLALLVLGSLAAESQEAARSAYDAVRASIEDGPEVVELDATRAEAAGELRVAARMWEQAGKLPEALRCARSIPDLDLAARLAHACDDKDAALLAWAKGITAALASRPIGSLTDAEAKLIRDGVDRALPGRTVPSRRR
jgi:hypothetical protein